MFKFILGLVIVGAAGLVEASARSDRLASAGNEFKGNVVTTSVSGTSAATSFSAVSSAVVAAPTISNSNVASTIYSNVAAPAGPSL